MIPAHRIEATKKLFQIYFNICYKMKKKKQKKTMDRESHIYEHQISSPWHKIVW